MAKIRLTAPRVAAFECPAGQSQVFLWDSEAPGLGVRVTANGARTYIFQGKLDGKTIRMSIGDPKTWPLEGVMVADTETGEARPMPGARAEARRLKSLIDQGIDPREQRDGERAAREARRVESERQDVVLRDAWRVYMEDRRGKWSERHYVEHERMAEPGGRKAAIGKRTIVPGVLASLMGLRLPDLTRAALDDALKVEATARPTKARQAFSALGTFFNWCELRDEYKNLVPDDAHTRHIARERLPKKKAKDDCLQREQLKPWFTAVQPIPNPTISAYLQVLFLTGARREEIASLKWIDVDFAWNSLRIGDKVEGERTIPLTPHVKSLLLSLKALQSIAPDRRQQRRLDARGKTWQPPEWVFASNTAADGKLVEPRLAHNKALDAANLPHVSLHGLRRSFGTLSEWVECPVGVVAQIQGHKPSAIAEKHYRRRPLDLLRMWHTRIETWILKEAGLENAPSDVSPQLSLASSA